MSEADKLRAVIADIAATNRRIDKHLKDQLDEAVQSYMDEVEVFYYGDSVRPFAVPVSSGEAIIEGE